MWSPEIPFRGAKERRDAQWEIDCIVAESLDVTRDELMMIYRTQFPVMKKHEGWP